VSVSGELAKILEFSEAAAHADMFRVAPPEFWFEVDETNEYVARFAPAMDIMMFNRAVGLGVNTPVSKETVDVVVQRYRDKGLRNFAIQLSPEAQPAEAHEWLLSQGLEVRDYWAKGYRPADKNLMMKTDLRIEQIDKSQATIFGETVCAAFGMPLSLLPVISAPVGLPGWNHYVAWDGDSPAAAAAIMVRDGTGWLGIGGTRPEFRGRGAQSALIARRIRDGSKLGCTMFVAETWKERPDKPNPSFHNMLHTGFIIAYDRPNYMLPLSQ
jgi:GNAT superfamily N-acetyltransferase